MTTTISSSDEDYLLNSMHEQQALPPLQVVTVSSVDELQSALRERDARIAFLERELVETRVQLAEKKSSEDTLKLELSKANLALSKLNSPSNVANVSTSELSRICAEDGEVLQRIAPENHTELQQLLRDIDQTEGNTIRLPLGQHISPSRSRLRGGGSVSSSRKRTNVQSSGNMNPGSCASGLDLLAGAIPRGASGMSLMLGSQGSINPMLGDIGLSSSEYSLKKCRSGDVAAGCHRRAVTSAAMGNYQLQRNEGWGDAGVVAPGQGNAFVPQGNALFLNANQLAQFPNPNLLPNANQEDMLTNLARLQGLFANAAAAAAATGPRENMFADLIRSNGPSPTLASTADHPSAAIASEVRRRQDQGEDAADNNVSSEEQHEE